MDSTVTATAAGTRLRYVTAAALFDGHDASINIIRRLLQRSGAEVIHLGHNRSVPEVVAAVLQEDADAVAVSSYQGGHMEYFRYLRQQLDARGLRHVAIFGGGGGVIIPEEIAALHADGITRVYSPDDGRALGLEGMIADMNARTRAAQVGRLQGPPAAAGTVAAEDSAFARALTLAELGEAVRAPVAPSPGAARAPVLGVTGTGGAGKSSLTDELVRRYLHAHPDRRVAIFAVDPSKRRTGGALLGDRIRMNAIYQPSCFLRSFATRDALGELSAAVGQAIGLARDWGFDLILVETSGIGQGDSAVSRISDVSVYVMTSEFGAATQLEKIDMIDYADVIVVNKFERPGAEDALRDVRKQYRRSRGDFATADERLPVFGTIASRFNDAGVNALFAFLDARLEAKRRGAPAAPDTSDPATRATADTATLIPRRRLGYLGEIAQAVRAYRARAGEDAERVRRCQALATAVAEVDAADRGAASAADLRERLAAARAEAGPAWDEAAAWDALVRRYAEDEAVFRVRDREVRAPTRTVTLAGTSLPRVALPPLSDAGDRLLFLRRENVPGSFPFTAGVFPFKRADEEPRRQFAGEGSPGRTNQRFHYLSRGDEAKRLSTAFDSLTLYGEDPDPRPDIFGKIGEGGVSICTLDDMKALYAGFDLCHPNTSVSMTINGPAPVLLAMFFRTAIDQQVERRERELGRPLRPAELAETEAWTLANLRGTVQADILKEDQAQNTCIFSTEFALRLMGDVQAFFVAHDVRNYYSVSISGYHIAEAGANPVSQLAFTLANGFTYVEAWRARGMDVDAFAPNLSFFFSNGLDAEYAVIGRVARRIWAIAMRDVYGASERSQKLKYHIQTSGRSLHAQEVDFNDIRTTLQALMAIFDNCNSLHTNSYDEAITTPSEESVRRAMAIQLIIGRELGWAKCENALQGSAVIDLLTDVVEEAVLAEFDRLDTRGGVLGAMETQYQRGRIQEESLLYEHRKHSGELPVIGVNTFVRERPATETVAGLQLARCTREEKEARLADLQAFRRAHATEAPAALARLQEVVLAGGNVFAELMSTVRCCSLGQITRALFDVGGQYRRAM